MSLEDKLKKLLEYSSENAIGMALSSASIGGKVRVKIDGVIRGKKGTITVVAGTNIRSGDSVGLSLDSNNKILAISQQSELLREEVIINDLWEEDEPKDPIKPTEKPLKGVVLFAVANKLSQTGEPPVPNCTCPTINRVNPTLNDLTFPSCQAAPEKRSLFDENAGSGGGGNSADSYYAYQELLEDGWGPWEGGFPFGYDRQTFKPELPADIPFKIYNALDGGDYYISTPFNDYSDQGSLVIFKAVGQFSVVLSSFSGETTEGFQPVFGGPDYSKTYLQNIYGTEDPIVNTLLDGLTDPATLVARLPSLGPLEIKSLSNKQYFYTVRNGTTLAAPTMGIVAAEYPLWTWNIRQITNPYQPWLQPVNRIFRVIITGLVSETSPPSGSISIRRYWAGTSNTNGKIYTNFSGSTPATLIPVYPPESGGENDSPYYNPDGAAFDDKNKPEVEFFNSDFYIGGFGEENLKLPVSLRGDDPYWGYLERIDTDTYEAIILTGSEIADKTKEDAEYFEYFSPNTITTTARIGLWNLALDKPYDDSNPITDDLTFGTVEGSLRYPNVFRYCKAHVFKIKIKDGIATILSSKTVNYPDQISDLTPEKHWLSFVNSTNTSFKIPVNLLSGGSYQETGFYTPQLPMGSSIGNPYISTLFLENIKHATPLDEQEGIYGYFNLGVSENSTAKTIYGVQEIEFLEESYATQLENSFATKYEEINAFYWLSDDEFKKVIEVPSNSGPPLNEDFIRIRELYPDIEVLRTKSIKAGRLGVGDTTSRDPVVDKDGNALTGTNLSVLDNPIHLGNAFLNETAVINTGVLQVSTTQFNQDPLVRDSYHTTPHKGLDIEVRGNRLTIIHLNQATKSSDDKNMSLGGAIIQQLPSENYKILGKVATYSIEKEPITGAYKTQYPNKRGSTNFVDYHVKELEMTLTLIKCANENPDTKEESPYGYFGASPENIHFKPTIREIEFMPIRRPNYYAIAILGVATN